MKKFLLYTTLLALCPMRLTAQPPDTLWTKTYGGAANDIGYSVQQTLDGGYIIVGETHSFGAGDADVWLLKTDENGDTVWTHTYGGDSADIGYSVQQTADSGYIIAGETRSFGAGGNDVYLIKTNSLGDTLWIKTYGGKGPDMGCSVQQTSDSGYIVVGWTRPFPGSTRDYLLIKTNALGDTLWTRIYSLDQLDYGWCVKQNPDKGYIIAGTSGNRVTGSCAILMRTDSLGNCLWSAGYIAYPNKHTSGWFSSVQLTPDGGYIAAGEPYAFLVKTDSLGDSLWVKRYGNEYEDGARSVYQTSDEGYIITGYTNLWTERDMWFLKTDENGDTLWTNTYGTSSDAEEGYSVQQTSDEGYIIVGFTESFGAGGSDVWLIKTEPDFGIEENESAVITDNEVTTTVFSGPLLLPEDKKCRVFDIMGRVVTPDKMKPGVYFLEIDSEVVQKVVKVR